MVERQLPKLNVAGSNPVSRSIPVWGDVAEWLGRGLQNLVQRFDSARRLQFTEGRHPAGCLPSVNSGESHRATTAC